MSKEKSWKFIPVEEVPPTRRGFYTEIINDFLESNLEVAKLNCNFMSKLASVRMSLRRAGRGKVRVFARKREIFLLRLKKKKES